jgi:hypothetical protein
MGVPHMSQGTRFDSLTWMQTGASVTVFGAASTKAS